MGQINGYRSEIVCIKEDLHKSITFFEYLGGSHLEEGAGLSFVFSASQNQDKQKNIQGGRFQFRATIIWRNWAVIKASTSHQIKRAQDEQGGAWGRYCESEMQSKEFSFSVNILTSYILRKFTPLVIKQVTTPLSETIGARCVWEFRIFPSFEGNLVYMPFVMRDPQQDVGQHSVTKGIHISAFKQPLWKIIWRVLKKLRIKLTYDSATPFLGIYSQNLKMLIHKGICALCLLQHYLQQPREEQSKCLSMDEWIKKMRLHIYSGILISY